MASSAPWRSRIVGHDEVRPADLVPNPENWRSHPQAQRDALGGALEDVGWVTEVIVNKATGHLVDGHLRLDLALSRNEPLVPVTYVDLTQDEERLVLATLDPLAAMADAEVIPLQELLAQLDPHNAALRDMLDDLGKRYETKRPGLVDPDDVPDLNEETSIKRGDLFALGDHRLMCGDSTRAEDVARLVAGETFHSVVTDPPYGIDHDGITNDGADAIGPLYERVLHAVPVADAIIAAFHSPRMFTVWLDVARVCGYRFERMLWLHRTAAKTLPWRSWIMASDAILLMSLGTPVWPQPSNWVHDTYEKTRLEDAPTGSHPTIKPVEVVGDLMAKLPAGPVLDPFVGSGTTIIAAEQLGRRCYAMEIDPRYVAVAIERWERFTGRSAEQVG